MRLEQMQSADLTPADELEELQSIILPREMAIGR
jgi:hypothetical protein